MLSGTINGGRSIPLINHSFEEPGTGKINNNWNLIPGWSSDTAPFDSGVEQSEAATDGSWIGFLKDTDPAIWQTTNYTILGNETFKLSFNAQGSSALKAQLYYKPFHNLKIDRI